MKKRINSAFVLCKSSEGITEGSGFSVFEQVVLLVILKTSYSRVYHWLVTTPVRTGTKN